MGKEHPSRGRKGTRALEYTFRVIALANAGVSAAEIHARREDANPETIALKALYGHPFIASASQINNPDHQRNIYFQTSVITPVDPFSALVFKPGEEPYVDEERLMQRRTIIFPVSPNMSHEQIVTSWFDALNQLEKGHLDPNRWVTAFVQSKRR